MRSNSASVTSRRGRLRCVVPALLTTASRRPCASRVDCTSLATSASIDTLAATNRAWAPVDRISSATRSPARTLMSFTITFAPSAAKRRAIPSPNPDAAPVTIAILPSRRPLAMLQDDRLQGGESVQRLEALLAAVAGMLDAAERQFDPSARAVAVDEHLAAADGACDAELSSAVARPDAGDESVTRGIREPYRLGFVGEGHRHQYRAEDLLAGDAALRGHVAQQARRHVESAGRRGGDDRSDRDGRDAVRFRFREKTLHAL